MTDISNTLPPPPGEPEKIEEKVPENPTTAPVEDAPGATEPKTTEATTTAEPPTKTPAQVQQDITNKLLARMTDIGAKSNFKLCLYGPPGGTKSSFLNIAGMLCYDQEDGLISLKSWAKESGNPLAKPMKHIPFTSFVQADLLLDRLIQGVPELDWVQVFAIDTFSDFHKKSLMEIVARDHANSPSSVSRWVPKVEHHQENNEKMMDFIRKLRDLDRNIVITAHSKSVEPKNGPSKIYPDFSESLANRIMAMMDIVGYLEMQEFDGVETPVVRVKSNGIIHAKTRIPLPPVISSPTYEQFTKAWQDIVDWEA